MFEIPAPDRFETLLRGQKARIDLTPERDNNFPVFARSGEIE